VAFPYWHGLVDFAERHGVSKLAVEMHANQLVYSVPSLLKLRSEVGPTVGANFDPSHLFWMGADVLAAVEALAGAIHHVHAKDTRLEKRAAVRSLIETLPAPDAAARAWNYVAVGRGHDAGFWSRLAATLRVCGYDGTLSIEHEDYSIDPEEGITRAAKLLREVVRKETVQA